ncbi:O-methyltransferase domain, partial [Dillenia turbinata]
RRWWNWDCTEHDHFQLPRIQGINFDLPHVIANAPPIQQQDFRHLAFSASKTPNFPQLKGNVVEQWVLHDWGDEHCLKMLKNCWAALPNNGKVIVVESIRPEAAGTSVQANIIFELDLAMMAQTGGKERTEKEHEALALKSGFCRFQVLCCAYTTGVMEFHTSPTPQFSIRFERVRLCIIMTWGTVYVANSGVLLVPIKVKSLFESFPVDQL